MLGVSALCGILIAGLALPVVGTAGIIARQGSEAFQTLPGDLTTTPLAQRSVVLDDKGKVLASFYEENRVAVKLDKIAPVMRDAIIAIEDARFYDHGPIDLRGTARAAVRNVTAGGVEEGGSTLTQQYVKLLLVSTATTEEERRRATEDSIARKLRELRLAMAAEQQFTKDEILERYLNIAYYGGGAYGVEAAARRFFSTSAAKLTLTQAATLAGLVQAPAAYDPERAAERALGRRNIVLQQMEKYGFISADEAAKARQEPLELDPRRTANGCSNSYAPFFCDYVYRELLTYKSLGKTTEEREQAITRGGLTIRTTLNRQDQKSAEEAISDYVDPTDRAVAAIAMVEPGTGKVRAIAHSREYGKGKGKTYINYAVDSDRGGGLGFQPGSTMKAFVVAAAIKQGMSLGTTYHAPARLNVTNQRFETCDGSVSAGAYTPKNYGSGGGTYNIRTGTAKSVNTFFIQLQRATGLCDPYKIAKATGLTMANGSELQQIASFTLGPNEVSPLAMAEAYATFAADGVHCNAVAVTSITNRAGKKLGVAKADCTEVLDKNVARATVSVLRGVMQGGGTGAGMSFGGRQLAGKTGTTNDARAVWFTGMTPQLVASVVVGDPDPPITGLDGIRLNGRYYGQACGGCIPGPIWRRAMSNALEGTDYERFRGPDPRSIRGLYITVPDVRGRSVSSATARLGSAGLGAYVAGRYNSRLPRGTVVFTSPRAGAGIGSGGSVGLYVSSGYVPQPKPKPKPKATAKPKPDTNNDSGGGNGNNGNGNNNGGNTNGGGNDGNGNNDD
jgi:membrane peptidoglycan carboxypeptidase